MTKTILIVVGIITVVAIVVVGVVAFLSRPQLPPSSTPSAVSTPVPVTPTPVTPVPIVSDDENASDVDDSGRRSVNDEDEDDPDVVPTQGGVSDGLVTGICDNIFDPDGIGTEEGDCGRCENLSGTDGVCEPSNSEIVQVIGCPDQTDRDCTLADGGIVLDTTSRDAFVSDYIEEACTIQLNVIDENLVEDPDSELTDYQDAEDYIFFQLDDCEGIDFPDTSTVGESQSDTSNELDEIAELASSQCGQVCDTVLDCGPNEVCGLDGICILSVCNSDPDQCGVDGCSGISTLDESDSSTVGDDGSLEEVLPTTGGSAATALCGQACGPNTACTAGNTCVAGVCVADFCADSAAGCDNGCQLPETNIISKEVDFVIYGALLVLLGAIAIKTNAHTQLFYWLGGRNLTAKFSIDEYKRLQLQKREKQLLEKRIRANRNRKSNENFEDSILKD